MFQVLHLLVYLLVFQGYNCYSVSGATSISVSRIQLLQCFRGYIYCSVSLDTSVTVFQVLHLLVYLLVFQGYNCYSVSGATSISASRIQLLQCFRGYIYCSVSGIHLLQCFRGYINCNVSGIHLLQCFRCYIIFFRDATVSVFLGLHLLVYQGYNCYCVSGATSITLFQTITISAFRSLDRSATMFHGTDLLQCFIGHICYYGAR